MVNGVLCIVARLHTVLNLLPVIIYKLWIALQVQFSQFFYMFLNVLMTGTGPLWLSTWAACGL